MIDLEKLKFKVVKQSGVKRIQKPQREGNNICYLYSDGWNDYSYRTLFHMHLFDKNGQLHEVGSIKIGYYGQTNDTPEVDTDNRLDKYFNKLPGNFFSLGTDVEYYDRLVSLFQDTDVVKRFLEKLNNVASNSNILDKAQEEDVFNTSFLRSLKISTIKNQYMRVLSGEALLTPFNFSYGSITEEDNIDLTFQVKPNSTPATNMHALIGRNGTGKTRLLSSMALSTIANSNSSKKSFYDERKSLLGKKVKISNDYFLGLILMAFSVFDSYDKV